MKIPNAKKNDRIAFFTWARDRYLFMRRIAHQKQHQRAQCNTKPLTK